MAVVHLSPELPRLTVRGHKREEAFGFLSASYPSPTEISAPVQLQRSYSGRPRSQSSDVSQISVSVAAKQRKSLRGLGRSRVGAGMSGWKGRQHAGAGENRRMSVSDADEATTEQIESAFIKIKEQLAKFSEEDQVLKERVDRLNEEINILYTPVQKLRETRSGHRATTLSPTWKSTRFSASVCERNFPLRTLNPRGSVPAVVISSSSGDNLMEATRDLDDPVHETIAEQEEGVGGGSEGVPIVDANGYRSSQETGTVNWSFTEDTLSLGPISGVSVDPHRTPISGASYRHK